MKKVLTLSVVALFAGVLCAGCGEGRESAGNTDNTVSKMEEQLNLTQEWDKVFPKSGKVTHSKITFHNRYGVTLAADLYIPKNTDGGKLPAIAVCGPFGAVKEQASGLYAQTLAERGFLTIAFDPSFTGESGGQPRYVARLISIRRISALRLIICLHAKTLIRNASVSSASVAGVEWPSMPPPWIPASRLQWLLRCMT